MADEHVAALAGAPADAELPVVATFAKKRNRGNIRKRTHDDEEAEESSALPVSKAAKQPKAGANAFTTKTSEDRKLQTFKFEANKTLQQQTDQGATRFLETETQTDRDARALREQVLAQAQGEGAGSASNTYKGMNNYIDYKKGFRRENTIGAEKGSGAHGPLRASQHIRITARFDYQPDICKDYKETGFCGYGDSCKFVHDRSDYKSGWELEKGAERLKCPCADAASSHRLVARAYLFNNDQWDEEQKQERDKKLAKWNAEVNSEDEAGSGSDSDDDLPFACHICRRPWEECQDPVSTRCKHYFCEHCALKHNAKTGKCAVCEQPTHGVFNMAHDITAKARTKKQAKRAD